MTKDEQALAEVMATEARWVGAHRQLDSTVIDSIMADDYTQITDSGEVLGKKEILPTYQTTERYWEIAEGDDYQVRLYGDTAVVIGRWRGKGVNHGTLFDYQARFMAIYVKRDGRWQLVADQSTPLS